MVSTSTLCQGLKSCMETQLPEQHVLISKLSPPRLTFSQSLSSKKAETEKNELQTPNANADNIGGWSFIKDLSNMKKDYVEEVYIHPLAKSSSTTLSIKSLEMCTESLGSETGSDISESIEENSFFLSARQSKCRETRKKHNRIYNFPPPLTSISRTNGVQVRPHREGGRLILKATSISCRKYCFKTERADGRLRLSFLNDTEVEDEDDEQENDDGGRKLASENGVGEYIRPSKCKESGSRIKGIPSWKPFWVAIS